MTSWTLDISKLQYYSTIGSLTVWGDPEAGDEIVLPNGFSYILPTPNINYLSSIPTSAGPLINGRPSTVTWTSDTSRFVYQEYPITPEESFQPTTSDEVSAYMREIRELGLLR
jgi:hypothetical protein